MIFAGPSMAGTSKTAMFYRYISENLTAYINAGEEAAGGEGFDYALLSDEEAEGARQGLLMQNERNEGNERTRQYF